MKKLHSPFSIARKSEEAQVWTISITVKTVKCCTVAIRISAAAVYDIFPTIR